MLTKPLVTFMLCYTGFIDSGLGGCLFLVSFMDKLEFRIEHIGLAAINSRVLRDWYVEKLSATEIWTDNSEPPAFLLKFPCGEILEIYPSTRANQETGDNKLAGWRHLALRVASVEATRNELERRGVVVDQPMKPAGGAGRVIFFKDIEGNLLHLVDRPEGWGVLIG